jgi:hypothetical protein
MAQDIKYSIAFAEGFLRHSGNQSLSLVGRPSKELSTRIQEFALSRVSC